MKFQQVRFDVLKNRIDLPSSGASGVKPESAGKADDVTPLTIDDKNEDSTKKES